MTKTKSRGDFEVDELPPWDDTASPELDEVQQAGDLPRYSYDSEQRTLVGIGPLGRARRSRPAAAPSSERMPQSEPPGPFIAEDAELGPLPRGRKSSRRAVAVSLALLVPLAAVGLVRRLSSSAQSLSGAPGVAATQRAPSPKLPSAPEPPLVVTAAGQGEPPTLQAPSVVEAADKGSPEPPQERPRTTVSLEASTRVPSPLPVKLAELPDAPTIVDLSNGDPNAGTIDIAATPPAHVVLDGRPLGKSPRVVRAPAGAHTLVFIHPLYGRRTLPVTVRSGATTAASTEF
ncbi:MAG TPA: PEGA domain-containing protein [Polyangiaceae bacterium]|nr:PEGA domain-containing protein [Polyangiaceae bacterium]